jgi:hypothetical protein
MYVVLIVRHVCKSNAWTINSREGEPAFVDLPILAFLARAYCNALQRLHSTPLGFQRSKFDSFVTRGHRPTFT